MKKTLGTYFSQYYKMPCLYRDDIEAIEKIIREKVKPEKYRIATQGVEYREVSDIPEEIEKSEVLVVYTHNPCLRLKFAQSWAELYCGDDRDTLHDPICRIGRIVSKSQRTLLWAFCRFSVWLAPLLGFGSLSITLGLVALDVVMISSLYLVVWFLIMASVWWGIGHRFSLHSFSLIHLHQERPLEGVWKRNREAIGLFLLGLGLGGVTTALIGLYMHALQF